MTFTLDTGLHVVDLVVCVIVLAMMKSDVNWLKDEVKHLRQLFERAFIEKGNRT